MVQLNAVLIEFVLKAQVFDESCRLIKVGEPHIEKGQVLTSIHEGKPSHNESPVQFDERV
jgi:hypothetical protein